jgi:multidrug resistance efflux pump
MTDLERAQAELESLQAQVSRAKLLMEETFKNAEKAEADLERLLDLLEGAEETLDRAS